MSTPTTAQWAAIKSIPALPTWSAWAAFASLGQHDLDNALVSYNHAAMYGVVQNVNDLIAERILIDVDGTIRRDVLAIGLTDDTDGRALWHTVESSAGLADENDLTAADAVFGDFGLERIFTKPLRYYVGGRLTPTIYDRTTGLRIAEVFLYGYAEKITTSLNAVEEAL